jgi:virginiamycin B lyase
MLKTALLAAITLVALGGFLFAPHLIKAANSPSVALSGQVSSEKEGAMEGVIVGAKKDGSTITIDVVTDADGRYSFPSSKLGPGQYSLKIRAAGYEMDGPKTVEVTSGTSATADIKLQTAKNLAAQLNNAEWLMSMPGTDAQKRFLLDCTGCHSLERIARSTHTADEFVPLIQRMGLYSQGSTPAHPQLLAGGARRPPTERAVKALQPVAEWLATTNLSSTEKWEYSLKTLPRPKAKAARVVVTEYDLPRKVAQPHDVVVDSAGTVWYSDFADEFLGKLDPKTGQATEYPIPLLKQGFPKGSLELQLDKDENPWLALMYQGGIAKFDRKTEKVQVFPLPKELQRDHTQESMVMPIYSYVDGKVWTNNQDDHSILRLDVNTGAYENLGTFAIAGAARNINAYGIPANHENDLYLLDFAADNIGRIDAKTKEFKVYPTPTRDSRPRRGMVDAQDRLWFAEYGANAVAMFDPKTEKIQEWRVPTPWSAPYQAVVDKNGDVWTASMFTDRVIRLNPNNGEVTEYLLPQQTNVRRVFVDNSTTPVTFWVGNNHGASIMKLEPIDENVQSRAAK